MTPILTADCVAKSFGARRVLSSATLRAVPGELRVLFGRNGVGKSTLLKIAAGCLAPDSGSVHFDGHAHSSVSLAHLASRGLMLPDDIAGRLEGKSSLGRLGLLTHSTAGWIDPGFSGHVTLELSNVATLPIKLWPGMKIGQLCLFRTSSPSEHPYGSSIYGSRYQDQRGPTPSRSFKNFYRADI